MESDPNNTFQGHVPSYAVLFFNWTKAYQMLQFKECLPAGKTISTCSNRSKMTQHWIIGPQAQDYAVVIPT